MIMYTKFLQGEEKPDNPDITKIVIIDVLAMQV